ncbi:hypothetical protein ACRRTK_000236 [Alexandromys fortis]
MEAYPDLEHIFKRFKNVLPQDELHLEEIDRGDLNSQLSLEQGTASTTSTNEEGQRENPTNPE